jgi:hypothetical protein
MASLLAFILVIIIINFDSHAGARQRAQDAKVMQPITALPKLAAQYATFTAPINKQIGTEISNYNANEFSNPFAARSALQAELSTDRSFDASLTSWLALWNSDYSQAAVIYFTAIADPDEVVPIHIGYSSKVGKTAQALLTANKASEALIARQAQAGTLFGMRSFNGRRQAANAAAEAQATLLRGYLHLPLP